MKKSRFTDSEILSILKQAESGMPIPQLLREHGVSSATFYKWRAKYSGMDASLMKRMKEIALLASSHRILWDTVFRVPAPTWL